MAVLLCMTVTAGSSAYTFDPNDFATQVVAYTQGRGIGIDVITGEPFTDETAALGRPTVDTTGDGFLTGSPNDPVTVVPVYPAFRSFEVVTLGDGGLLTVKFNRKVFDDPFNSFGLDLTVFGNASSSIRTGSSWTNGSPDGTTIGASTFIESGRVEVSQDGTNWFTFNIGPFADAFAPTLGRVYDATTPAPGHSFWGQPTDPTLPLNPAIVEATLQGMTVTEVADELYGESAGGTSFDFGQFALAADPMTGLKWIQYVRVLDPAGSGTVEIDAIADVAPSVGPLLGDANNDGQVTGADLISVQQNFGNIGDAHGLLLGDADDNGLVTGADLILVQKKFGKAVGAFSSHVPEPTAVGIVCLLSTFLINRPEVSKLMV